MGHHVTGVDSKELPGVGDRTSAFFRADLDQGIPPEVGTDFDVVLAGDVIEHLVDPGALLDQIRTVVSPEGSVLVCVPNFAHWYPRSRSALGMFDYDQRGILDATHLHFFTRRSITKLLGRHGYTIDRVIPVGLPLDSLDISGAKARWIRLVDHSLLALWPTMFAYQFIIETSLTAG
jgi:SAM-dependent methyltransferase